MLYAFFCGIPRRLNFEIRTPGNYPEESKQHSEQGESLKSRIIKDVCFVPFKILIGSYGFESHRISDGVIRLLTNRSAWT
jgi:hypothetical protein